MELEGTKKIINTFINNAGIEVKTFELKEAIKNMLQEVDRLQEENEELKTERDSYRAQVNSAFDKGFIHKDKIREKIEKLKEMLKKITKGELQKYTAGEICLFLSCLEELLKEE